MLERCQGEAFRQSDREEAWREGFERERSQVGGQDVSAI